MVQEKTDNQLNWQNIFNHIHRNRAINKRFYDWNGIKYTLWEWERRLQGDNKPVLLDYLKVETHLIYDVEGEYWNDASFAKIRGERDRENIKTLCYSLGNISINKSKRQSNTFEKMKLNMSNGSYSDADIAKNYNEWTDKSILHRGLRILKFIEERWNVNYSDISPNELELKRKELLVEKLRVEVGSNKSD